MAEQEDKLSLSKKGKREVSPFVGHELLYDHLMGNLDQERQAAVTDHLKFSRDAQLDLAKIEVGLQYAEKLSETVVSQPIMEQIGIPSNYLTVLMQKSQFERWPQGLKWGLEALVVVAGIVIVLTLTPWQKVVQFGMSTGSKEVILAEVSKTENATAVEEKPQFQDEGIKPGATPAAVAAVKASVTPMASPSVAVKATPTKAVVAAAPAVKIPTPAPKTETATAAKTDVAAESAVSATGGGFLYRGEVAVTNLAVVGPKITEKINELGGRKAGAVELGWQKTETSMYYHFTIPEARYQDLLSFLSVYGKPGLSKEKHPRVMPDGIIRLILTVDEDKK
jgi:hypothetical protein